MLPSFEHESWKTRKTALVSRKKNSEEGIDLPRCFTHIARLRKAAKKENKTAASSGLFEERQSRKTKKHSKHHTRFFQIWTKPNENTFAIFFRTKRVSRNRSQNQVIFFFLETTTVGQIKLIKIMSIKKTIKGSSNPECPCQSRKGIVYGLFFSQQRDTQNHGASTAGP